jgi:hypothetical protein
MMQRVWAKLVIASLIILGDSVFSSESTLRSDDSHKLGSITAQPLLLPLLDAGNPPQDQDMQESGPVWRYSDLPCLVPAVFTAPLGESPKYHAFNPRAPPVPAS